MKIIDKNKDFYDFYSYIYGIDNTVTYDRRKSILVDNTTLYGSVYPMENWIKYDNPAYFKSNSVFHLLETGDVQYIIEVKDVVEHYYSTNLPSICENFPINNLSIKYMYIKHRHIFEAPVSICPLKLDWIIKRYYERIYIIPTLDEIIKIVRKKDIIQNPVLKNTVWTRILDAENIWKDIQNYLSSLHNDKDIDIKMTEKQKAQTHGFDKYSFRNPVK